MAETDAKPWYDVLADVELAADQVDAAADLEQMIARFCPGCAGASRHHLDGPGAVYLGRRLAAEGAVVLPGSSLESARAAAVALEQECALLADTLALFTHEYDGDWTGHCRSCNGRADEPGHRTPDWLRKRHGLGV